MCIYKSKLVFNCIWFYWSHPNVINWPCQKDTVSPKQPIGIVHKPNGLSVNIQLSDLYFVMIQILTTNHFSTVLGELSAALQNTSKYAIYQSLQLKVRFCTSKNHYWLSVTFFMVKYRMQLSLIIQLPVSFDIQLLTKPKSLSFLLYRVYT